MRDCPSGPEWQDPDRWWNGIRSYLPADADYIEVVNECGIDGATFSQFSIRLAELANDDGWAILAFSFPPGNPELSEWSGLVHYLRWAGSHPLSDGRYNGVALHQSAYTNLAVRQGSWLNSPWIAGRHRLVWNFLRTLVPPYDHTQSPIPWVITEVGVTDGYSGSWTETFSCEQKAAAYRETRRQYQQDGLWLAWWNIGSIGKWTDDSPCLELMLR